MLMQYFLVYWLNLSLGIVLVTFAELVVDYLFNRSPLGFGIAQYFSCMLLL